MTSHFEEITRDDWTQYNYKSDYLGRCYTFDWDMDPPPSGYSKFKITWEALDGREMDVAGVIAIGCDGHNQPVQKTKMGIMYTITGKFPQLADGTANTNSKFRIRYWLPCKTTVGTNHFRVTEEWFEN